MYIEDKETPDLNSLLKEEAKKEKEPKKNQIKVYRFWQKYLLSINYIIFFILISSALDWGFWQGKEFQNYMGKEYDNFPNKEFNINLSVKMGFL